MNIRIDNPGLSEKDIEDWLYANPSSIPTDPCGDRRRIVRWIGRQYHLPSGVADLIGRTENDDVVVIEVKRVPLTKLAILQVARYASDIEQMMYVADEHYGDNLKVHRLLIGPSIDEETLHEAFSCGVRFIQFQIQLHLALKKYDGDQEASYQYYDRLGQIGTRPEWSWLARRAGPYSHKRDEYDELMDSISNAESSSEQFDALGKPDHEQDAN